MLLRAVNPKPEKFPDQWADENRRFPATAGKPGAWNTAEAVYTRGPSRAATSPSVERVAFIVSSQNGKTQTALNIGLSRIDQEPVKVLYIGPTRQNVTKVIFPKVDQAIRLCSLREKAVFGQKWTATLMPISGVSFRLAWGGSPIEMAADDACIVLIDEIDRMDRNVKGEGSVIEIGDGRHGSYLDGKTVIFSTPTEGAVQTEVNDLTGIQHWKWSDPESLGSQIWEFWQSGTRHEFAVPCPHCEDYFVPRLAQLHIPDGATPAEARENARLTCFRCGVLLDSDEVRWAGRRGVYLAPGQTAELDDDRVWVEDRTTSPARRERIEFGDYIAPAVHQTSDVTFWSSGLISFSAKNTVGALAAQLVKARLSGQDDRVRAVINTKFAEPFAIVGEAPDWEEVKDRCGPYIMGQRPPIGEAAAIVTMGVDVQKRSLPYVIRLWLRGLTSYLIEEGELWAPPEKDTEDPSVWRQLSGLVNASWSGFPISRVCVDSGYRPNMAYLFTRAHPGVAVATKGRDRSDRPFWASRVDVDVDGRTIVGGQELWLFSTDQLKQWVHSRFRRGAEEHGAWYVPSDISETYCREIVAEHRMPDGKWVAKGANHKLDCEVLAYLGMRMLGGREVPLETERQHAPVPAPRRTRQVFSKGIR